MKSNLRLITVVANFVLIAPAMFLVSAGMLYLAFGLQAANDMLDVLMATAPGRLLFSPVAVLGGPLLVLTLNVPQLCRFKVRPEDGCVRFSLSLQKATLQLIAVGMASLLIDLLLAYAFVENFKILPR
jgi:hypothetical protein